VRHIRLIVEYDGTSLCGWQRQANGPTVQQHLEEALAKLLDHEVTIAGASRTDAGVHARGQVASFRTERTIPLNGIRRGLNSLLPDAVAVREATEVDDAFHPRFARLAGTIATRSPRADGAPPRIARGTARVAVVPAMQAAGLARLSDMTSQRSGGGCSASTTMRRVDSSRAERARHHRSMSAEMRSCARWWIIAGPGRVGTGRRPITQVAEIRQGPNPGQ
jgi:tRNA pseudouridine38-40 synthase